MHYFIIFSLTLVSACSFQSKPDDGDNKVKSHRGLGAGQLKKMDSDGDMINDFQEQELGLDRFIANLPQIKVNFLQNYNIGFRFEDETEFNIDTAIRRTNPDFKYRVGDLFLKKNSLNSAARIGRFSGVSWGDVKQKDFSWVSYPEVDKEFYHSKVKEYQAHSSKELKNIEIELENSIKLVESGVYNSIEQLELNFYYYSYEKETYVQLHTQKLDRTFHAGIRENFHISILNPPKELLEDNYLRRGEFIISEVKDFYIPDLGVKHSTLLKSVKNKSIPVYRTTPFENEINYVAISDKGERFVDIMEKLFADKFTISEDQLFRLEQFENNLQEFKYLHELRGADKEGRWFVMTNKLKRHYLKHAFTQSDSITISYITGDELSKRPSEKISSSGEKIYSGESFQNYALGSVSNNSIINFSVYIDGLKGKELKAQPGSFSYRPPNCRNCTGNDWSVNANFTVNTFKEFEKSWEFVNIQELNNSLELLINNNPLNMAELVEANHATYELRNDQNGQYVYFKVSSLHKLDVIASGSENVASLKISPVTIGVAGNGLQLDSVGGHNIDKIYHGGLIAFQEAGRRKIPIAVTGWKFDQWQKRVPWGVRGSGYTPTKGQKEKYWDGMVVDVVSTITNHFN